MATHLPFGQGMSPYEGTSTELVLRNDEEIRFYRRSEVGDGHTVTCQIIILNCKYQGVKADRRYMPMDKMQILDRLVSIRSNAYLRASEYLNENPGCNQHVIKAATLESGINQLIMEIQNHLLAEQMIRKVENPNYRQVLPRHIIA